jgi:hypothetical protein
MGTLGQGYGDTEMRVDFGLLVLGVYAILSALFAWAMYVEQGVFQDLFDAVSYAVVCCCFVLWYAINPMVVIYASRSLVYVTGWKLAAAYSSLMLMLLVTAVPFFLAVNRVIEFAPGLLIDNEYGMYVEIAALVVTPIAVATLAVPLFVAGRYSPT